MMQFLLIICTTLVLSLSGKTPLTGYLVVVKGCMYIYTYVHVHIHFLLSIYVLHRHGENPCFRKPALEFCYP